MNANAPTEEKTEASKWEQLGILAAVFFIGWVSNHFIMSVEAVDVMAKFQDRLICQTDANAKCWVVKRIYQPRVTSVDKLGNKRWTGSSRPAPKK